MAKALFRFLRGELNGYYLNAINNSWNEYTSFIRDFFAERSKEQFNLETLTNKDLTG